MTVKRIVRAPVRQAAGPAPRPPAVYATPATPQIVKLRICSKNFVYAGPVKIGRYDISTRTLVILDKCKRRGKRRGSRFVRVSVDEFSGLELLRCRQD